MDYKDLSQEQQEFVTKAKSGCNILVDACIGSGKTTAIQLLCEELPEEASILYLTYNALLKMDARDKIQRPNVRVENYHSFVMGELRRAGRRDVGVQDSIQCWLDGNYPVPHYDVLILDEYQDVEEDLADILLRISQGNPGIQKIAVGDMAQKIYDKTRLDVFTFIQDFLGPEAVMMEFTQCFRLSEDLASPLSTVWDKDIRGMNPNFSAEFRTFEEIIDILTCYKPEDILVLGANRQDGDRQRCLNELERRYPERFNKYTCWSKIMDGSGGRTYPQPDNAIFTTYDGCKGMERDVCVVFDWSEDYWYSRTGKPGARYEILRNVFCVAASRGKRRIVFCEQKNPLDWDVLSAPTVTQGMRDQSMQISMMFDFKYDEDIRRAAGLLEVREIQSSGSEIDVELEDGLIDLSPCIGNWQEASYFLDYDLDGFIVDMRKNAKNPLLREGQRDWECRTLDERILYLTALETGQLRYLTQVHRTLVSDVQAEAIHNRLAEVLPTDNPVQLDCRLETGSGGLVFSGRADAMRDNIVYELKFVSELTDVHKLQLAVYLCAMNLSVGRLWNVRDNRMLEVRVPDRVKFLNAVTYAVTKGQVSTCGLSAKRLRPTA